MATSFIGSSGRRGRAQPRARMTPPWRRRMQRSLRPRSSWRITARSAASRHIGAPTGAVGLSAVPTTAACRYGVWTRRSAWRGLPGTWATSGRCPPTGLAAAPCRGPSTAASSSGTCGPASASAPSRATSDPSAASPVGAATRWRCSRRSTAGAMSEGSRRLLRLRPISSDFPGEEQCPSSIDFEPCPAARAHSHYALRCTSSAFSRSLPSEADSSIACPGHSRLSRARMGARLGSGIG
mmetsp:Transcript_52464/g.170389  ORF Transcript_52464/g.170389 Transcript_52464/m.170389 type:complete len:239 (-) Transcript_52464:134-850(-)